MTNAERYLKAEQERWALEFLRDISFDYNTLHRIDLSSLEQARDIAMEIVGKQHREITELKREIVQLKEEYNSLEKVILSNIDKKYEFIGRDDENFLYVRLSADNGKIVERLFGLDSAFPSLFQFIKRGEEYEIEELLKDDN